MIDDSRDWRNPKAASRRWPGREGVETSEPESRWSLPTRRVRAHYEDTYFVGCHASEALSENQPRRWRSWGVDQAGEELLDMMQYSRPWSCINRRNSTASLGLAKDRISIIELHQVILGWIP